MQVTRPCISFCLLGTYREVLNLCIVYPYPDFFCITPKRTEDQKHKPIATVSQNRRAVRVAATSSSEQAAEHSVL